MTQIIFEAFNASDMYMVIQEYLMKVPSDMEYTFNTAAERDMVYDIKVNGNEEDLQHHHWRECTLPTPRRLVPGKPESWEQDISSCRQFRKQSVQAALQGNPWNALPL